MTELAYIGLGSNVADPQRRVREALAALAALAGGTGPVASSLYRSEPLGDPGQPWFVNAVVELPTDLEPGPLLDALHAIERAAGRRRDGPDWAPRPLDLDLLLYGRRLVRQPGLEVPHPRFPRRRFVLAPLAELAPRLRDPVSGASVRGLLSHLDDALQVEKLS